MDTTAIFELITKGLTLLPLLISAGSEIGTLVEDLMNLSAAGASGTVTDEQLTTLEATIDAKLADFNTAIS